jgi:hypothetical protein
MVSGSDCVERGNGMTEEYDEFDTDKGLKDDFDGVIQSAMFAPGEYGTTLTLNLLAEDGDEIDAMYRVGPDWATFDGGQTIEHPSKKVKLNSRSQASVLVRAAMDAGAEKVIRERSAANDKIGPRGTVIWPGLKFHWGVVENSYDLPDPTPEDPKHMRTVTSAKQYPTEFLGEVEVSDVSTTSSTGGDIPESTMTTLTELAQKFPFKSWVDECLKLDECHDTVVVMKLSDESFYDSLRG